MNKLAEFAERIKPLEDIVDEVVQLSKEPAVFGIDIEKGRKIKEHIKVRIFFEIRVLHFLLGY